MVGALVRTSRKSALGRLLFARDAEGNVPPIGPFVPTDEAAWTRFGELARRGARLRVGFERSTLGEPVVWAGEPRAGGGARRRALRPRGWTGAGGAPRTATSPRGAHEPWVAE